MTWVKLATLEPGTSFLTQDGRMGRYHARSDDDDLAFVAAGYLDGQTEYHSPDLLVLPLDPTTLAADLAEREGLLEAKVALESGYECQWTIRQAVARERERACEIIEKLVAHLVAALVEGPTHRAERTYACYNLGLIADAIRALGPPPEPEAVYRERGRYKAALEKIVEVGPEWANATPIARAALGS